MGPAWSLATLKHEFKTQILCSFLVWPLRNLKHWCTVPNAIRHPNFSPIASKLTEKLHIFIYILPINNLAFFSPDSRTICIKLRTRASHHTVDSLYKIRADRIAGSLAIHHFGISEQTCCSSLVPNSFGPRLCKPNSCITKSISSQFRLNRPTRSLAISKSNFSLNMSFLKSTDFARNSQATSAQCWLPLDCWYWCNILHDSSPPLVQVIYSL